MVNMSEIIELKNSILVFHMWSPLLGTLMSMPLSQAPLYHAPLFQEPLGAISGEIFADHLLWSTMVYILFTIAGI